MDIGSIVTLHYSTGAESLKLRGKFPLYAYDRGGVESMKVFTVWLGTLFVGAGFLAAQPAEPADNSSAPVWSATAAARYLDARQTWWQGWDRAKKDHDTTCISCHTVLPYALGRPALRRALGETGKSPAEQTMLASVEKRVRLWDEEIGRAHV